MKKGYRLNSAHAYANYYADVTRVAEFRFGVESAKRAVGALRTGASQAGAQAIQKADDALIGMGQRVYNTKPIQRFLGPLEDVDALPKPGRFPANRRRRQAAIDAATAQNKRKLRLYGGAVAGTGALATGGAGYAGYRAMRGNQEEQ